MSLQYDLETPVNVPALSSITKAQFIEIINTLKPLANIGGVIVMSGAGGSHPDVTNNPRSTFAISAPVKRLGSWPPNSC